MDEIDPNHIPAVYEIAAVNKRLHEENETLRARVAELESEIEDANYQQQLSEAMDNL